jgi:hypothetical protein
LQQEQSFGQVRRSTHQTLRSWSAIGERGRRDEHEVVGVGVAVEAAAAEVAGCVLICAPVDTRIVHEEERVV